MRTIGVTLFYLSELPTEKSKERARDFIREQIDSDDFESTVEDCKDIACLMGFDSEAKVMYSGFYTQGSGACIVGRWDASRVKTDELKKYAPKDEKLHAIVDTLHAIAQKNPDLSVKLSHTGHYYHEHSVDFEFENEEEALDYSQFKEAVRDLMRWCYAQLKEENDHLNSDEYCDQEAEEREYEFTEDGRHWRTR